VKSGQEYHISKLVTATISQASTMEVMETCEGKEEA